MIVYEAKWDQAARDAYLKSHPQNFAGPDGSFPIRDASDVGDAWGLAGHAANPDAVRAKIKEIAARMGFSGSLPDTAKEKQEAQKLTWFGHTLLSESQRPQKKIGTLPICWLEYNARSLNGRIYPKSTCDAIFRAAQRKLANPDAMPPTTFVSHEAANGNVNVNLVGAPVKVWQEGSKFWAHIDLADTSVGRDMLALVEGKYLRSGSMRVQGVELMHDRNYDLPLVVVQEGVEPEFMGIDLTTNPGLASIARIPGVLYESAGQPFYTEAFNYEVLALEWAKEVPLVEIPIFVRVALGVLEEAFPSKSQEAHARVHDHLAGVLDEAFGSKHGSESARFKALIESQFDEAGRAIAKKHADRLIAAHDESAKACAMECVGVYGAPSDTDNDGDNPAAGIDPDNDGESHTPPALITESQKEETTLTEEEMLAALKAKGYTGLEAPKTDAQKIAEQESKIAALEAKFAQLQETAPTQRQTLASPSQLEESTLTPEQMYQEGDYLKGDLSPKNWKALANPAVPWPKDLHPKQALKELAPFLTHRLLSEDAAAQGRSLDMLVGPNDNL